MKLRRAEQVQVCVTVTAPKLITARYSSYVYAGQAADCVIDLSDQYCIDADHYAEFHQSIIFH